MADSTCSIEQCSAKVIARGWCRKHYKRWYKHGDPEHVTPWSPPPQNLPRTIGCKISGCDEKHFALGYCKRHHAQANYAENRDARRAQQATYREGHRDENRARAAEWRRENPELVRESLRVYYEANQAALLEYARQYRSENPDVVRASNQTYRAKKLGALVIDLTLDEWSDLLDEFEHSCAYCGATGLPLTQDHRVPLTGGGDHTKSNVVPACQPCNSRKGTRTDVPFDPRFQQLE